MGLKRGYGRLAESRQQFGMPESTPVSYTLDPNWRALQAEEPQPMPDPQTALDAFDYHLHGGMEPTPYMKLRDETHSAELFSSLPWNNDPALKARAAQLRQQLNRYEGPPAPAPTNGKNPVEAVIGGIGDFFAGLIEPGFHEVRE